HLLERDGVERMPLGLELDGWARLPRPSTTHERPRLLTPRRMMRKRVGQLTDELERVSSDDHPDLLGDLTRDGIRGGLAGLELPARADQLALTEAGLLPAEQHLGPVCGLPDEVADAYLRESHGERVVVSLLPHSRAASDAIPNRGDRGALPLRDSVLSPHDHRSRLRPV